METFAGLIILFFIIFIYFLPSVLAWENKNPNFAPILIINIFLGWTLLGWVISLAMAVSKRK